MMESREALSKVNTVRRVHRIRREAEQRLQRSGLVVILLGSSGRGLDERRDVAHVLARRGIVALVPEDDFPVEIGPSVLEVEVLERSDVDLVFLSIESWGAAPPRSLANSRPIPKSPRNSGSGSDRNTTRSTVPRAATSPTCT